MAKRNAKKLRIPRGKLPPHSRMLAPRKSGRPSRPTAEKLRDHILEVASALFLKHGFGLTSIEAVAHAAHISKRTFYDRFENKADLFHAVVCRIIECLHPPAGVSLEIEGSLEEKLQHLARLILQGALTPQGLGLTRLTIAESARFPELAAIITGQGGRDEAITLISGILKNHAPAKSASARDMQFLAQQFLQMVITVPQRRALGLGTPMTPGEMEYWIRASVELFLNGCRGFAHSQR